MLLSALLIFLYSNSQDLRKSIDSLMLARKYSTWSNNPTEGLLKFGKNIPRAVTMEDINLSKKYWGWNTEKDTRFTIKDLGKNKVKTIKYGALLLSSFAEIIPPIYDFMDEDFIDGKLLVSKKENCYFINKNGEIIDSNTLSNYGFVEQKYDGFRKVRLKNNDKWGFVDERWNLFIPCLYYIEENDIFREGHCPVKLNGIAGIINTKGEFTKTSADKIHYFENGIAEFEAKGKKGIMDTTGNILVPAKWDNLLTYKNYFVVSNKNTKWGLIDINGKLLLPLKFDDIRTEHLEYNFVRVVVNGKWGVMDMAGNTIIPINYDYIDFSKWGGGRFYVELNKKKGVFEKNGKAFIPVIYDNVRNTGKELEDCEVLVNNQWTKFDNVNNGLAKENNNLNTQENTNLNSEYANKKSINQNSNQANKNSSNDCDKVVDEYLVFAKKAIAYYNRIKKNISSSNFTEYSNWDIEIRKKQNAVMICVDKDISYGVKVLETMSELSTTMASVNTVPTGSFSSNNNSKNTSSSKPNTGKNDKHSYKVLITWNNPNCGSCPYPSPSAQNGIVDYFYEKSGSYRVIPVCPICEKKQYNTISGFTSNIGTRAQGSKEEVINCN